MRDLYSLIRPGLFCLPAERAHTLAHSAIRIGLDRFILGFHKRTPKSDALTQSLWGLTFENPIGLAAGFDKDARLVNALGRWGFGFVEFGTVTPKPQPGNQKPRVFRLEEDEAIVNNMGFNSEGLDAVAARLERRKSSGIVGLNLGKNKESENAAEDYAEGIRRAAGLADYVVVNVSSPNTPGLRDLQSRQLLTSLLHRLLETRHTVKSRIPLLLKIAPDLAPQERQDVAEVAMSVGIDGMIVANTTITRPGGLNSGNAKEIGGLSGRPLFTLSTDLLAEMYRLTQGRLPLIGVGGICGPEDAYAKIRAGASLVQVHTALIYSGPALVEQITRGIAHLLLRDGFVSITDAVGAGNRAVDPFRPVTTGGGHSEAACLPYVA
jgi:dihydroorotate dehydrogenase